jgi:ATP-dependent helicase/nuclease subunit B
MAAIDASKRELNAMEFGTLAHHAFHQLALDPTLRQSTSEKEIADFLIETARAELHRCYGRQPAPLVSIQFEALLQNLRYAAETEAAQRQDGWQIYAAEMKIGSEPTTPALRIEDAVLRGKIDRVDRHESSGHLRLIDFKTSDKARDPREAHASKVSARRKLPESELWKTFEHAGETWLWQDLQLPLYAAALRHQGLRVETVGYFCLPKSVQETGIKLWEDFSRTWEDQALNCAAEIVRRLREGRFWPPTDRAYAASYEELFLGEVEQSVEPIGIPGS